MSKLFDRRTKSGFTLVELIVVIAILAILAGVAIPVYSGYIKKANEAADQQLLAAVNSAFAAACLENGFDAKYVTGAYLRSASGDEYKIGGVVIESVDTSKVSLASRTVESAALLSAHPAQLDVAALSDKVNDAFMNRYFKGNENIALKSVKVSGLFFAAGVFGIETVLSVTISGKTYTYTQSQVDTYANSNYNNVQPIELTTSVDSLSTALGDNKTGLAALANTATFKAKLVELGVVGEDTTITAEMLSDATLAKEVANASVLYVAQVASTLDPNEVYDAFVEGNIDEMISGSGLDASFVTAALEFGLLTAFVNTEDGAAYKTQFMEDSQSVHGLTDVANLFRKYTNDKDFGTYYDYDYYLKSNAAANDIKGFLSALSIINENATNFDLSSVYSDGDILAAVTSILGNN